MWLCQPQLLSQDSGCLVSLQFSDRPCARGCLKQGVGVRIKNEMSHFESYIACGRLELRKV